MIWPVSLPLKTDRQRRAALAFAAEPALSEPVAQMALALGPQMPGGDWLCVAMRRSDVAALCDPEATGAVLPDSLAVPLPALPNGWAVWCGRSAVHVRRADGAALAVMPDQFAATWRAFGTPPIELMFGQLPPGIVAAQVAGDLPGLDPAWLRTNLADAGSGNSAWRSLMRFAAAVTLVSGVAHGGLLVADARALDRIAGERTEQVQGRLDRIAPGLDAGAPGRLIRAELATRMGADGGVDGFLPLLAQALAALPEGPVDVRDLRYDHGSRGLTILMQAGDLDTLQRADAALRAAGMNVRSGAATLGQSGAEMQIFVTGDP
ncbi:MAG: hypothetical protein ACWA5A_07360 [Marinibacterium sp.]